MALRASSSTTCSYSHSFGDVIIAAEVARNIASHLASSDDLFNLLCTNGKTRIAFSCAIESLRLVINPTSKLLFSGFFTHMRRLRTLVLNVESGVSTPDATEQYTLSSNLCHKNDVRVHLPRTLEEMSIGCYPESAARHVKASIFAAPLPHLRMLHAEQLTPELLRKLGRSSAQGLTHLTTSISWPSSGASMSSDELTLHAAKFQSAMSAALPRLSFLMLLPSSVRRRSLENTTCGLDLSSMLALSTLHIVDDQILELSALPPNLTELRAGCRIEDWPCWHALTLHPHPHLVSLGIYNATVRHDLYLYNHVHVLSNVCSHFPNLRTLDSVSLPEFASILRKPYHLTTTLSTIVNIASSVSDMKSVLAACPHLSFISGDFFARNEDNLWPFMTHSAMARIQISAADLISLRRDIDASAECLEFVPITRRLIVNNITQLTTMVLSASASLQHVSTLHMPHFCTRSGDFALLTNANLPSLKTLRVWIEPSSPHDVFDFGPLHQLTELVVTVFTDERDAAQRPLAQWHRFLRTTVYSVPPSVTYLAASMMSFYEIDMQDAHFSANVHDASIDFRRLMCQLPRLRELDLSDGFSVAGFDQTDDARIGTLSQRHLQKAKLCCWRDAARHPFTDATLGVLSRNIRRAHDALPSLESFTVRFVQPCWFVNNPPTCMCTPLFPPLEAFTSRRDERGYGWREEKTLGEITHAKSTTLCYDQVVTNIK